MAYTANDEFRYDFSLAATKFCENKVFMSLNFQLEPTNYFHSNMHDIGLANIGLCNAINAGMVEEKKPVSQFVNSYHFQRKNSTIKIPCCTNQTISVWNLLNEASVTSPPKPGNIV